VDGHPGALQRFCVLGLLLLHPADVGPLQPVGLEPLDVLMERVALVVGGELGIGDLADGDLAQATDPVLAAARPHTSG
jgi:hypothetical protein